jgi:hypothetical protein
MRASDPAGYEGIEKLEQDATAEGRGLMLTSTAGGTCTFTIETNEIDNISRDYEAGTTSITRKTLTNVVLAVAANSTVVLPLVGKFTLTASSNATAYVLR